MCGIDPVIRLWHLVDWRRTPASISTSRCFEGSICRCAVNPHCANTYYVKTLLIYCVNCAWKWGTDLDMHLTWRCMSRPASLPVGLPWRSDPLCALDVGRELSKLHCRNGAEANSMLSRRRYNYSDIINEQFLFSPLYLCVNKLSDYKYATMISFLLAHGANEWFQAVHRDCFCYPLDWSSSCFQDEQGNLLICTNNNAI